jgi:PAS domain S-box-containing protein
VGRPPNGARPARSPNGARPGRGGRPFLAVMLGRLRWSVRGLLPVTSPPVMAQAFAYLYGIGGSLVLLTLLLPHDPDRFVPGLAAPALIAYVVASLMVIRFDRIPMRVFYLLPGLGSLLITSVVYSGGADAAAAYSTLYFWAVLAAFSFFDFRSALPTLAVSVGGYAVALGAQTDAPDRALNWLMVSGTLTVAGILISLLRQRSERLVALLGEAQAVAHIGSWEWHIPSDEVAWSDELFRIYGLDPGGFPGSYESFLSYVHPEDRAMVDRALRKAVVDHASFVFEHRITRPDGVVRILHGGGQVATDDSGRPMTIFGTSQDVTDQRRTEGMFRDLVESAPDAMVILNEEAKILLVNAQAEKLFGYARDELVGETFETLVPERYRGSHPLHRAAYLQDPGTGPMGAGLELWGSRRDGTEFPVEITLSPLQTEEGVLVSSAIRDITERKRAEVLERSYVPERLPEIPGVRLAARFVPGGAGVDVGGDWYDVLELGGERIGLAIGDVAGRGVQAASLMGQLRNALRAYAFEAHPPGVVLERLNNLAWSLERTVMVTLIYLVFDASTGLVRLANAGHLPPLEKRPDGTTVYLEQARSLPLGVGAATEYGEIEYVLEPGSTLLLYTDGLVEERRIAIDEGLARLARSVNAGGAEDLDALCDRLLASVKPGAEDDVAMLALEPLPLLPQGVKFTMPAEPRVLNSFRGALRRWLRECEAGDDESYEIILACNEAFANSVEHAYGPGDASVEVEAALAEGIVSVTVRDFGRWRAPRGDHRGRGLSLMESVMDSVTVRTHPDEGTEVQMTRRLARSNDDA